MNKQLLILLTLASLMIGCRSVNELSMVDTKPLDLDENIDKTVKPGNDFFMYANGMTCMMSNGVTNCT